MRVLIANDTPSLTPATWDALIAHDPRGHLLQTWAWGELKAGFGWSPLRVVVEQDGAAAAAAQVLYRRAGPWTIGYLPKGPAVMTAEEAATDALWAAVHRVSRQRRALLLKVEPEWYDAEANCHAALCAHGLAPSPTTVQPRRTIIVDLQADEETLLARMKSKWRYNVRLAARKGIVVRAAGSEGIDAFYALMVVTGERDAFGIHSKAYYRQALELFAPQGRAELFLAEYEGTPVAGLMAYAFNGQAWYLYGASSNAHRERMPNHALQWHAMRWAKGKGCTQYDLWGIPDADEEPETAALRGVQRFKEGFGGAIVCYVGAYDYVYRPRLYPLLERAWALRRRGLGLGS
ncbi:MAG TPA: peptidoglycan bridge formation glycyltransferase FemA/FemB family protein [Chloroflexi bacterium]|jgi:peptidoglycan pentaglycine glycine transferase (the first glycine)|nr:peptidoglycan bridge formation glycyltransferase FemA/FemB family protein [Chloroflexota bacterium]